MNLALILPLIVFKLRHSMKVFLLLLVIAHALSVQAQLNLDSLQQLLDRTTPGPGTLQAAVHNMQILPPHETEASQIIADWIIKNSNTDSLLELRANANLLLGKAYTVVLNFDKATQFLTTALSIAERNSFYAIEAETMNTLGSIYDRNELNEKAREYYRRSLEISRKKNYAHGIALAEFNLGNLQLKTGNKNPVEQRNSISRMVEGFYTINELRDTPNIIAQSSALGHAYTILKVYDSAALILNNAEKLIQASGREAGYIRHYTRVAKLYNDKKKYNEAITYYERGLSVAKKYQIPRWLCMYYSGLAETYELMGDYKRANEYNQLNIKMHDALVSKENFIAAADINNRYERQKKDNEILQLAAVNKQKSTLNKVLIGASVGLLLISFLGYRNFENSSKIAKQEKEIQLQKIQQLEKDKQLVSIDAMLKGQEEERSRIAKDLHDGLGGMLSGTKLSFMNVKDTLSLTPEISKRFDRSISMLDNTISDLRKVAQNLMPEALVKFGLHEALRDFCNSVQSATGIKILFHPLGELRKPDKTAEVFTYRIIQELVNNVVKHAGASQVIVQLSMDTERIGITVEDNGKGFDRNVLKNNKGSGIANIYYRVQYLNGTTDIVSSPGNGTSVNIELKA